MPELPEVETIRRELEKKIISHPIKKVEILAAKSVHGALTEFKKQLLGNSFKQINRRGKLLLFTFRHDGYKLLIHLKMTGQLVYQHPPTRNRFGEASGKLTFGGHNISESDLKVPNRFTRAAIYFSGGGVLYFNDMRRFGFLKLVKDEEVEKLVNKSYGLDALDPRFDRKYLAATLKKRGKTSIKAALLDQKHLAGIGNIYADEICFAARVKPNRRVSTLSASEIAALYAAIKYVLNLAIKYGGTTFNSKSANWRMAGHYIRSDGACGNFTDYLKVFDRTGQRCARCKKGIIQKTRVAGRGTHFCPVCQK